MNIRQMLWDSACAVADHIDWSATPHLVASPDLERRVNGGVAPNVARHYGRRLIAGGLPATARILDLGCGYGRIAMELARQLGSGPQYVGLDPNAESIDWARRHISTRYPNFSFAVIDVRNGPYNPDGVLSGRDLRFPIGDGSLDLVCMISVLTHVDLPTVENYIREAGRTLKPDTGRLVATAFLLDDEVEALLATGRSRFRMSSAHGPSRVENRDHPELAIAHPRAALLEMLDQSGFAHSSVFNGHWSGREAVTPMDFQDLLVADRAAGFDHEAALHSRPPSRDDDRFPQAVFDRLDASGFRDRQTLLDFVAWSASVTLNALWWQESGLTLALAGAGHGQPERLRLTEFRRLGLETARPDVDGTAPDGRYRPMEEPRIIALLVGAGRTASRDDILASMLEAAENGFLVLDAFRAGRTLVLCSPGAPPQCVDVPGFTW